MPDEPLDQIEALLRATGRRPGVPADRAARVSAAAREHWRSEIRHYTRRRRGYWAAGLAAAIGITTGLAVWQRPREAAPVAALARAARVEIVQDSAWSRAVPAAAPRFLRPGDQLNAGWELATPEHGRLALRLASGHSVRLDAGTRVTLLADGVVALAHGAIYIDSKSPSGAALSGIEIRTPLGSIRDVGTQFEVRWLTTSVRVRVREGKVDLQGAGTTIEVGAGHELEVAESGRIERREWASNGLDWIDAVTPMFQIDGRSLKAFLDWLARERGLQLRFATPRVAAAAAAIRLSGSVDGMTLDQALESALVTSQMSHRIDRGVLFIQAATEPPER